jgi:hypothetical protein
VLRIGTLDEAGGQVLADRCQPDGAGNLSR